MEIKEEAVRELTAGYKRSELLALAQQHGIALSAGANKDDIAKALINAQAEGKLSIDSDGGGGVVVEEVEQSSPVVNTRPVVAELPMVTVRPRRTIPRFRVGDQWYSVFENRTCKVPPHVRDHLAEKGVI